MKKIILIAVLTLPASAAPAQSPEGRAYYALNKCVVAAAERYSSLSDPIGDVADTVVAACGKELEALDTALGESNLANVRQSMTRDAERRMHQLALKTIADARLKNSP